MCKSYKINRKSYNYPTEIMGDLYANYILD